MANKDDQCIYCQPDHEPRPLKNRWVGVVGLIFLGSVTASLVALTTPFLLPAFRSICLPFIPATESQIRNLKKGLRKREGTLIDLGSGDGRVVLEAAKMGFVSVGVELNPWLIWYSRINSWIKGFSKNTKFVRLDLWKVNLSKYQNIVIFGVEEMMPKLESKLTKEVKEGSIILACRFPLPNFKPFTTIGSGLDCVWIYSIPKNMQIQSKK